ncbi:MAG: hypothetical protein HY234_01760 [Acidobacteria bacterium]|nr:hypothetical protein [Acidobacteriota bacterium]MBI3661764.1 hypothetical protein [Acidobacteriota bacterium]
MALGRTVTAAAHLDAASDVAALIPLKQVGEPPDPRDIPVLGFLSRRPLTHVNLLNNINPQRGRQTQINGLLVVHPDAPASQPQVVFITVTAL